MYFMPLIRFEGFLRRVQSVTGRLGLALMILFGLAAPAWGQSDAGREAYRRGEYATAYRIWKPLAEQGNAAAQYNLGLLYQHGLGVERQLAGFPRPTTGLRCPRSPRAPYEVNVRIEIPPVPVNHEFGIAELGALSFHRPRARVLGLAKGSLQIKTSARFSAAPSGDGFCFWVTAVDVTLSYLTMEVYVAKEYGPRTCPYRVILEHEKEHVRAARRNLRRYAPRVRSALTSLLIPTGREPVAVASPEDAEREVQALSRELLEPVYEKMIESLHRSQAALDTPEQYRRVRRRCRRW